MHVSLLEVRNFRGIRSARILLENHAVLLGNNTVGKTAIIDALALVVGRDKLVRNLGDYDFFGGQPGPASRIQIKAVISGFDPDDPVAHPTWFNPRIGGIPYWWDGDTVHAGERPDGARLCACISYVARFDHENLEVDSVRFFHDGEGDPFEGHELMTVKREHLRDIGFYLLPSRRTWDRVVSFGSELFRRVLRFQDAIPSDSVHELKTALRNPTVKLEEDSYMAPLIERVSSELNRFMECEGSGLQFRPTSGDTDAVLQVLTPHLQGQDATMLPIGKHGSGVISLQTLLLLFEFGRARHSDGENFILAAEEPELHLHPGHHRRLVSRIRGISTQSITTTHSPEIAAYFRPQEILLLRNANGVVNATPLIPKGDNVPQKNALMRLFTVYRSQICEALMHRMVLLPEGLTEFRWLHALASLCITAERWDHGDAITQSISTFGVLPTQDSHVIPTFNQFNGMIPRLIPLVDGDTAGNEYVKQLIRCPDPPAIVLQLDADATIETVLARIVEPDTSCEWDEIEEIVGATVSRDVEHLKQRLAHNDNKKNWRIHEELLEFVAASEVRCKKASAFLSSLAFFSVEDVPTDSHWVKDGARSNDRTAVWQYSTT